METVKDTERLEERCASDKQKGLIDIEREEEMVRNRNKNRDRKREIAIVRN